MQVVERWMLARLRHHTCCSLLEWNTAMADLLVHLNRRPFKKLPGSRQRMFESLDRPARRPLPTQPSASAEWTRVRVHLDDHVEVDGPYDAVPYRLVKPPLDVRLRAQVGEIVHTGTRVARHQRSPLKGRHTTGAVHRPKAHQHDAAWTPPRLVLWAAHTGEAIAPVVDTMLASRPHPQQGFRAGPGLMRLGQHDGPERLEAACRRAIHIGAGSYTSSASILTHALDQQPLSGPPAAAPVSTHGHSRGAPYDHTNHGDPAC